MISRASHDCLSFLSKHIDRGFVIAVHASANKEAELIYTCIYYFECIRVQNILIHRIFNVYVRDVHRYDPLALSG